MIPNWVAGAAARDAMNRPRYGSGGSTSGGCTGGFLCAIAVPVIALWGYVLTEGSALSNGARVFIMACITLLSIALGFGKFGPAGPVAKVAYSLLAGYAVFDLAHRDGGGGYIAGVIAFLVIVVDQFSRKS